MSNNYEIIQSKKDLLRFIKMDLAVRGIERLPKFYQIRKPIVHYTVLLRKVEYLQNVKHGFLTRFLCKIYQLRLKLLGAKLGFSISPNTFGPGLYLVHWGSIVVSSKARFGSNSRLHSCVNVSGAPVIGENVYLGPGAVITGDISIGNNVTIGANTVVYSSFPDNVTVLGNPARVVKKKA
ncbi:MAG: serine acetyltransferase [Desulfobacteraceae bacterium]|nr:MAG: serine acetyltransferase [Desulfobacteraceae bacterium]